VVGDLIGIGAAQEQAVIGDTPNLAARLQAIAAPGAIVIAENTRRLAGNLFDYQSLGEVEIKGFATSVPAYRVLRESRFGSRFEALRSDQAPLIGRDEELELLNRRWAQAKAGAGRVVLISAEPGIGKSRLTEAFRESLKSEPPTRLRYFCLPHHQDSALFPFIGQLERTAGIVGDDSPEEKLDKLRALVSGAASPDDDLRLLAELLSIPLPETYPALELNPQRKKEMTLEVLLHRLARSAQQRPVLMIFEDLHWADPSSRELLDLIVGRIEVMRVLLIATLRPEFQAAWTDQPHVTSLSLRRLDRHESDELARGISGDVASLPNHILEEIVERTDGVPLFIEELTKAVLETAIAEGDYGTRVFAVAPARSLAVPATLHASLMARLDRLGTTAKEIAQVGAAIGRDFSYELLAAVVQRGETELQDPLGRLVAAGLLFQRGLPPQATFSFKHGLVQDMAYSMMLRGPRQALHARIARVLEELFPAVAETQPQLLARHFTEAGSLEEAIIHWCRAGKQSAAKSALIEAIEQLKRGLQLLSALPDSHYRKQQELELQVTMAGAFLRVKSPAHAKVAQAFSRARDLIFETNGVGSALHFSVLYGLWVADYVGGNLTSALERAGEFLSTAESQTDSGFLLNGHRLVGSVMLTMGDYPEAFSHLERAAGLYISDQHRGLALQLGVDPGLAAGCLWATAVWHRGYPIKATESYTSLLREARQCLHPYTFGYVLAVGGLTAVTARQASEVEEIAGELASISSQHGFALFLGLVPILRGWLLIQQHGDGCAAAKDIREGLATMRATGSRSHEPIFLGFLAEALGLAGQVEQGLAVLAEALEIARSSGAKGNDAELNRIRGELLGRLPSPNWMEIEASLFSALAISRAQGTRGLELRAAFSLARLLRDQSRRDEARDLLAPIYSWFTEGFDLPDLKQAKELLDDLG
jgi:predicted ATPase